MIDRDHQRRGYARQALTRFLQELSSGRDRVGKVRMCCVPDNEVSWAFYKSLGFV
jgi:RimJ/RimL family protein N-acetyltransferase